jgi:hypothetical protein
VTLYHLPKGNLPPDFNPAGPPRFVLPHAGAAGLALRDARLDEFPAEPDPDTGGRRVRAQYLFDVQPDPADPRFVICQVAEVMVRPEG